MSKPLQPSREVFSQLDRLMNTARQRTSGASLLERYPRIRSELVNDHWLIHCDTTDVVCTNDDERPYEYVEWDSDQQQYRYFNPYDGWVTVDSEVLKIYQVNSPQYLKCLQQQMDISDRYSAVEFQKGVLWYLGVTRITSRRLHVYYACHIDTWKERLAYLRAVARESGRVPAVIIMSGEDHAEDVELPLDMVILPLERILCREGSVVQFDHNQIIALLKHSREPEPKGKELGLRFSTDYRLVYWNGKEYRCTKKQAAVIEEMNEEGGRAHKDILRAAANTNAKLHHIMRDRINGKFYPHPLWGTLIKGAGGGIYYFDH